MFNSPEYTVSVHGRNVTSSVASLPSKTVPANFLLGFLLSATVNRPTETHLDYVAAPRLLVFLTRHCLPSLSKLTQYLDPPLLDGTNCFLAFFDLRLTQCLKRPTQRYGKSRKARIRTGLGLDTAAASLSHRR